MEEKIVELARRIGKFKKVVAFTGAGISTESGLPDFRGPAGLWKKYKPIELGEFIASSTARYEYWRRKLELYPAFVQARPNTGHLALVELYKIGYLEYIITQNIDGLHQKAGFPEERVIELHGSGTYLSCLKCGRRYEWEEILPYFKTPAFNENKECPLCQCGGWLKPATISFGQALPEEEVRKAFNVAVNCHIVLAVGSSLQVYPAAQIPLEAKERGSFLCIINNEATAMDFLADLVINTATGRTLSRLTRCLMSYTK